MCAGCTGGARAHRGWRAAKGYTTATTAAEDPATGELVAVTDLMIPPPPQIHAQQGDTVVRRDHRGHGLGRTLKLKNLELMATVNPVVAHVHTWNASENRHMLAINSALGFHPVANAASLQRGDKPEQVQP